MLELIANGQLEPSDDAKQLTGFLEQSRLVESRRGSSESITAEFKRGEHTVLTSLLHNYISFRIPLVKPEAFLDLTLPWVMPLVSRGMLLLLCFFATTGGYFAARQWDQFVAMFWSSFTIAGAFGYATTLFILKFFHELGHAYTARHFGCRVPSIGVAFMVMTPMLYTDASDAWRLSSRRQRFLIGVAGVFVEIAIATLAIFLWAFLPDGPLRAICFFIAATAWVTSLFVNLSPFMRFDGYHMLVDALGMHSVGPRSFALATWRLRELLFKPDDPPPEVFSKSLTHLLIAYAVGTCVYRLTLFLGIAWFLYISLPKAAGLPLAGVEIYFFTLLPIIRELKVWKSMGYKHLLSTRRAKTSALVGVGLLVLAALPLDRHVQVPAVLLPAKEARLFAPEAAVILKLQVVSGEKVEAGDIVAQLFVPEIGLLQREAQLRLDIAEGNLQRVAADRKNRAGLLVLEREKQLATAELEGLRQRGRLLSLRAPIAGTVTGDAEPLHEGQWVGREDMLFRIVEANKGRIVGLLLEREVARVQHGAHFSFIPQEGFAPARDGLVNDIGVPGGEGVAVSYLSSQFGGVVPANPGEQGKLAAGYLPLEMLTEQTAGERAMPGTAIVEAVPESLLGFMAGRVATVMLRESGF
jgi:putative peptide zinc metalloprotease protein